MLAGIKLVEDHEHIEESTAVRKLIRTGLERTWRISIGKERLRFGRRSAADLDMVATVDVLVDHGVSGNLDAGDVLSAMENLK